MKKTRLLYSTFDGDLKRIWVTPNYLDTKCSFRMEVWGGAEGETK